MDTWEKLRSDCSICQLCALGEARSSLVFGTGSETAEIMLIGEGPGEQEDIQGVPFVGPAGQFLDSMLQMIDLDRSKVYIGNVVKCRPPRNRDPLGNEQAACRIWLDRQIALLDPKLIVCLGRIAAQAIINPEFRITREHGIWYDVGTRRCMATYHPSALLRDPLKRPEAFSDLRSLRSEIRRVCEYTY